PDQDASRMANSDVPPQPGSQKVPQRDLPRATYSTPRRFAPRPAVAWHVTDLLAGTQCAPGHLFGPTWQKACSLVSTSMELHLRLRTARSLRSLSPFEAQLKWARIVEPTCSCDEHIARLCGKQPAYGGKVKMVVSLGQHPVNGWHEGRLRDTVGRAQPKRLLAKTGLGASLAGGLKRRRTE